MGMRTIRLRVASLTFACIMGNFPASSMDHVDTTDPRERSLTTKQRIDLHVESPELNLDEMRSMMQKTIDDDPYFLVLKPFFEKCDNFKAIENLSSLEGLDDEGLDDLSQDQKAIISIYTHTRLSENKEGSIYKQILKLGNLYSLFLSYKSLTKNDITAISEHKYGLIQAAGRKAQKYLLSPADLINYYTNKKSRKEIVARITAQSSFQITSEPDAPPEDYLHPLVLLEGATFDKEDFFYALSKGIVLFGVQKKPFPGHGRVFESPYLAWRHDLGHFLTLCKGSADNTATALTKHVKILEEISAEVLKKADHYQQKGESLTGRLIIDTSFNAIHETNLPSGWVRSNSPQEYFKYILTTAIKHDMGFSEFEETVDVEFAYRFLSDLPKDLVRREPLLQERIQINQENRTKKRYLSAGDYNWETTLDILHEKFNWLKQMFPTQSDRLFT